MNKQYKFLELSKASQKKAIKNYIKGWEETHDEDDMTFEEVKEILTDNNDDDCFLYDINGNDIPDIFEN